MNDEEKQLLLIDFCGRLPHGVMFNIAGHDHQLETISSVSINVFFPIEKCKPYLRPLSSMTEEEARELASLGKTSFYTLEPGRFREIANPKQIDWLNANHFDFRGLIPKDLAIEASRDMYSIK